MSFAALENRHLEGERMAKAVALVTGYRTYLMYHVKCTKSEMASRMRDKSNAWLQVMEQRPPLHGLLAYALYHAALVSFLL